MICTNCGQNLPEGVKFCGHCGAKVYAQAPKKRFCTMCGAECEGTQLFCNVCGVKLSDSPASASPASQSVAATPTLARTSASPLASSGRLLKTVNMVSMYKGEPTVGYAESTGKLLVYDDRIEFKKQFGNALAGAFGLVGLIAASRSVKKDPVDVFPISQISELKVGAYMGLYNTLVIKLKDGTVKSFCPGVPGSSISKDIIELLRLYV